MDADVLQNIDLFPVTNSKFSSISFWDNFDNQSAANLAGTAGAQVAQDPITTTVDLSNPSTTAKSCCKKSPKPVNKVVKSGSLKRQHTPERKRSKVSNDSSALDCCDYWLRFDSDDDSLERLGDYDSQTLTARSALDHALSSEEDSFSMALDDDFPKREPGQTPSVAPERLYSTPLSWDKPQAGVRNDSYFNVNPSFNDPERQRLLAIAMGSGIAPTTDSRNGTAMDFNFDFHPSPTATSETGSNPPEARRKNSAAKNSRSNSRSGQITPPEGVDKIKDKPRSSDRAAHNDIERKYRTNLKDRIAELREAIPSLRSIPEDYDDEGSPVPVSRAPKGTILTKATEYIHQLERRNRSMAHKNDELLRRLQAFEQLLGANSVPTWQPQGYGAPVFNPTRFTS
ncbi:hypothetical protein BX600DRAFT_273859 [Xylariales sp. PMI_506]|nr:hypothetical protein BX600DRAFT_273859 [Xylariales sp. PMI_506]